MASQITNAQESSKIDSIKISDIVIIGNKKTKNHIIIRELDFKSGDKIATSDTLKTFSESKNKIFNTGLFVVCDYQLIKNTNGTHTFLIHVKENWYIWPLPYVDLGDRNFNEWWQERDKDLGRLIYGIHFRHDNFRGRNERLKLKLEVGFARKYELFYTIPYINKKRNAGLSWKISYSENKRVAYQTNLHKLDYLNADFNLRNRFYFESSYNYRQKFFLNHKISGKVSLNSINDTIAQLNNNYFLDDETNQNYITLSYSITYDKRDIQYYPLKGIYLAGLIRKDGLGIFEDLNQITIITEGSKYYNISKALFGGNYLRIKVSSPTDQPYYNTRGLGYNEQFIRGYELYVIDGQHYLQNRNELKLRLLETRKNYASIIPVEQFQTIPISIYLSTFIDYGYVIDNSFNPNNQLLSNTSIYGYGLGLNIVSFYDSVLRIELSKNDLNETGLFFHLDAAF